MSTTRDRESAPRVGVVAIGRNEGERLRRCLQSLAGHARCTVYVDSGSKDDSLATARALGVEVVELDLRVPFTAARARNAGYARLRQRCPDCAYVQFVDGDCEVVDGWLEHAARFLDRRPDVAVVAGRRRERHPEHSLYNMMCDIEWDTPVGETKACGGDAMIRLDAFDAVGGFRADLIAGEEPELCVRLRSAGWRIWRLGEEMTLHDAAMSHFGQWWTRALRSGFTFAQGAALHGRAPERHRVRETMSVWFWGLVVPFCTATLALAWGAPALALLLLYPLQVARIALRGKRAARENWWRALFIVVGKFPEMLGQVRFLVHRFLGAQSRLIEYK